MAKKNESTAPITVEGPGTEFDSFQEEQISFPPYWEADVGKWFYGLVMSLDDRDPDFVRYVVQACKDIKCSRGSKDEKTDTIVKEGEFFTLSAYAGLPLENYIGIRVLVQCTGTREVGRPQPMWDFRLRVSPEDKKLLSEDRKARATAAITAYRESKSGKKPAQLNPATPTTHTAEVIPF